MTSIVLKPMAKLKDFAVTTHFTTVTMDFLRAEYLGGEFKKL